MIVLAGLGNPGDKYARNRHNIGFMAVDEIVRRHHLEPWRNKFKAEVCDGLIGSQKVLMLKPQTFMNLSGEAIGAAMRYYDLDPADVIVIHDELDLPPGKLRTKTGGGHAGHNGLRSIHQHIGPDFHRIRLGIGHPGDKNKVHSYVLKDFAKADGEWLDELIDAIAAAAPLLAQREFSSFQNKVHLTTAPAKTLKREDPQAKKPSPQDVADEAKPDATGPFAALKRLVTGNSGSKT